jgi:hypothetical protein
MKYTIEYDDDSKTLKVTVPANGFGEPTVVSISQSLVRVDHDASLVDVKSFPREKLESSKPLLPVAVRKFLKL